MNHAATQPPRIFDSAHYARQQARARRADVAPILHELYARAVDNLCDLSRRFPRITAVGVADDMLQEACNNAGYATQIDAVPTDWLQTEILPLAPASCDAIVSVCGLHTINDMVGSFIQLRQALTPDGVLVALLPGPATLSELRDTMAVIETAQHGGISPRIAPFLEIRDAGNLLGRAGFALPVIDSDMITLDYSGLPALHADLRAAGQSNMLAGRAAQPLSRSFYHAMAQHYAAHHSNADGRLRATLEVVSLTAWSPHASQQKPLQRGSGELSLKDFLEG